VRDRARPEADADRDRERVARPSAPRVSYAAPKVAADPFFDQPYEASEATAAPAWEAKASTPVRGLSPNIKSKKKVAALFGAPRQEETAT
jgi:ATP-dependent RNA helicase RhlE